MLNNSFRSKSLQKDDFYLLEYLLRFNYPIVTLSLSRCFMRDEDALNLARALRPSRWPLQCKLLHNSFGFRSPRSSLTTS